MSFLDEHQVTLIEATKLLPGRPHPNTLRRWASEGCDGTRLRTWKVGGRRVTSKEALEEFILARSGQHRANATHMRSASHQRAVAALDAAGIR